MDSIAVLLVLINVMDYKNLFIPFTVSINHVDNLSMMMNFAKIFFYMNSCLCLAYFVMVCRLSVGAILCGASGSSSAPKVDNLYLVNDERVVNGIMYLILGLFLLYVEIYMYRIYSLSQVLSL